MNHGYDAGEPEPDEHKGTVWPPGRGSEVVKPRDNDATETQDRDLSGEPHQHRGTSSKHSQVWVLNFTVDRYTVNRVGWQKKP